MYFAETEITLQLCDRLPPRPDPYSHEELGKAVSGWHTSIEIAGFRIEGGPKGLGPLIIADGAAHRATILGSTIDPQSIETMEVSVQVGDTQGTGGMQSIIWDHILDGLGYLVANQERLARRIHFDDIVMTGSLTGMIPVIPGAEIVADFGGTRVQVTTLAD